jgi:seryl-tRNA synthetase
VKEPETSTAETPTLSWRAAIDFKKLKDDPAAAQTNADNRAAQCDVAKVCELYDAFQSLNRECDEIREARNLNAKSMKGKLEPETRAALIAEGKELKEKLAAIEGTLGALEFQLQSEGQKVPNDTHPETPLGGEELAVLRKEVGKKRDFSFEAASHVDVGERLGMFDFETGGKVCGSRFVYLTGAGAMLELALINWAMAKVVSKGFRPMVVPDLVRQNTMEKCGFQPRAENTQVYNIENSDLCLAGTAEILLGGVYMDEVLAQNELPLKMAAFSHCFRTEAGAAGAATRGLYRLHQFSKVEMFVVSTPEQSDAIHDELIAIEEEMYSELGFHFKVLDMASEDLGAPAYRKFDIEAWMPALGRYGEISSASNCTDYQARRLNIKYRPDPVDGKKQPLQHCHTLNATACAVPRMIITILENFQNEDGSVTVPEPLRAFMGGVELLTPTIVRQNADDAE